MPWLHLLFVKTIALTVLVLAFFIIFAIVNGVVVFTVFVVVVVVVGFSVAPWHRGTVLLSLVPPMIITTISPLLLHIFHSLVFSPLSVASFSPSSFHACRGSKQLLRFLQLFGILLKIAVLLAVLFAIHPPLSRFGVC